jgi:small-conductance mechanosensitive channel
MFPPQFLQDDRFESIVSNTAVQNVVVSLLVVLAAFILSRILQRLVPRYIEEPERRYKISKVIGRTLAIVAGLTIIVLWSIGDADIITLLTVIGAGLAIALREVLLSFVGWINIVVRSPFKHGDRIEVNGVRGDVIDIRLFHSTLMEIGGWVHADQSTGRIVHIPNAWIYQFEVYNYTRGFGFVWNEIPFTVTYRSDWKAAREIILDLASETADLVEHQVKQEIKRVSSEYLIHYSILSPFVYVKVIDNGVQLCLRYLTEVRKRRGTEHAITLSVLEAFTEHGQIEMAYSTSSLAPYDSPQFGPFSGTRGERPPPDAGKNRGGIRW